jgi:hypothetical protein
MDFVKEIFMRSVTLRRLGLTGAMLAAGLLVGSAPALAEPNTGVAGLGSASFVKNGLTITVPPQASCNVDVPPPVVTSGIVTRTGITFGGGTATCDRTVVDPQHDVSTTKSEAIGKNFELSALVSAGGPRIKLAGYKATCSGNQGTTSAGWGVNGLSGLTGLPNPIPSGYVYEVKKGVKLLATITFGEFVTTPADGSISLTALRVRFQPDSAITGEVVLGTASCGPTP